MKNCLTVILLLFLGLMSPINIAGDDKSAKKALQESIERGRQHFFHDSFGSKKTLDGKLFTCSTCHAGDSGSGRWPTLINAAAIFPKYNSTIKKMVTLETQVQRCIKGGIGASTPPSNASPELVDMLTYLQFIARDQPIEVGGKLQPVPNKTAANKGLAVFETTCFGCHGTGVAGAPKIGDVYAWTRRVEQSIPTLYTHAIAGFKGSSGIMPPKGGNAALTEDDVKAAVDYMLKKLQDTPKTM